VYFTFLGEDYEKTYTIDEMRMALEKAVSTVIDLQKQERAEKDSEGNGTTTGTVVEPSSLNLCTTDGTQLLAFRFRNSSQDLEQPPSLYYSTKAGPTLNRKYQGHPDRVSDSSTVRPENHDASAAARQQEEMIRHWSKATANRGQASEGTRHGSEHGKHVIVASEPTTFDQNEWELIGKNQCVMVGADMSVRVEDIRVAF